jgi:Mg/Co/Ni transporter MgtE
MTFSSIEDTAGIMQTEVIRFSGEHHHRRAIETLRRRGESSQRHLLYFVVDSE